jgi:DNA polymerase-3 subunit gamma/tau
MRAAAVDPVGRSTSSDDGDDDLAAAPAEFPDDDDVDLDDLIDAPPESVRSPIDRLAEAFPGSELVEDAS